MKQGTRIRQTEGERTRSSALHRSTDPIHPTKLALMFSTRWIATILTGFLFVLGCSGGGDPTAPPSGWQTAEMRMWKEGVDTSEVFRNLEDLDVMGVTGGVQKVAPGSNVSQTQFTAAIKRSLVKLYRNNPTAVDSLFEEYARPKVENADLSGEVMTDKGKLKPQLLQGNKKKAYEAITEYFREPQRQEAPSNITYPDSLRTDEEASGEVELQVHIDTSGAVDAVEAIRSVHPTLDAIAMNAATRTSWEPAYVLDGQAWEPVQSWTRFSVPFPAPRN